MQQNRIKLTKSVVDAAPIPGAGYTIIRDSEQIGFGVRITAGGVKSYFVERRVNGKPVRSTIGRHGEISASEARSEAQALLGKMTAGHNPVAVKKQAIEARNRECVTFRDAANAYITERSAKKLKPRTIKDYRSDLAGPLGSIADTPIESVDRAMIARLHADMTTNRGPTTANRAMRFCRAVFNYVCDNEDFTQGGEPLVTSSPVNVLKKRRLWNKNNRRKNYLDEDSLGRWLDAVLTIDRYRWCATHDHGPRRAECAIGYYLLLVCLGLRSGEACAIEKAHWRPETRELLIADPKNSNTADDDFIVPVGWRMEAVIKSLIARYPGRWLLWSEDGNGPITDPKAIKVDLCKRGAKFSPHSLRRTFASLLNELSPAPSEYQIKRLLNHTPDRDDVTTEYIQHSRETLRAILQRVEDSVFSTGTAFRP